MKKQIDEFQKLKTKDTARAIEDMTYQYIQPDTNQPTVVPAKHYENILNSAIEEVLDQAVQMEMLNTIYKQMNFIKQEYGKDFIRALLCIDLNLKPTSLSIPEKIALDGTYSLILDAEKKEKKGFHLLDSKYLDSFENLKNDKDLHASMMNPHQEVNVDLIQEKIDKTFENENSDEQDKKEAIADYIKKMKLS